MFGGREVGRRLGVRKFSMPYAAENMPMVDETERGGLAFAALALITAHLASEVRKGTRP
jgi:hypothetical protein